MSLRPLSKELQEKAIKELHENAERIPEDVEYIRKWLKQTKYINARTEYQWIVAFLRGCKFSLERTKEKLETFHTMRTLCPEFFKNRDPMLPELQDVLKAGVLLPLPQSGGPDTPKIMMFRVSVIDPSKISMLNVMKVNMMVQEILLNEDDQFIIAGGIMLQDLKGFTMDHIPPLSLMKKAMTVFQEAYPIRPKATHFLNVPTFFDKVYNMIKVFLNEKMRSRVVIHTVDGFSEVEKSISKSVLPKEYGGEGPSVDEIAADWKKKVESYRDWFIDDEKYGTDEKKRPGKPKTSEEYFGLEGSFRKLNVD